MSNSQKNGKRAMHVAIYILLFTWILLLVLLVAIYVLRLQGYENFTEWMNRNDAQETLGLSVATPVPTPDGRLTVTVSPEPTKTPSPTTALPTDTPISTSTVKPTVIPVVTATPIPTEMPVFSGVEEIDADIREKVQEFSAGEETLPYETYVVENYFSVVFRKAEYLLPLVYDLTTKEQMTGSDLIKETYFAITKERLQKVVAEKFPSLAESEFVTYEQVYQAEDYQQFYLTEEQLVFCFAENSLTEGQPPFTYEAELSEAKAFFHYNMDGTKRGPVIRELDPEAKMIALTFDDGPHPKVEDKLLELLEQYDVRATFFFLGERAGEWYPKMPGKLYEAGHEIASHTYSHTLNFATASMEEIWSEINATNLALAKSTGYAPDYVRFPGGTAGKRTKNIPMLAINWNIDSVDYREKNKEDGAQIIYERLIKAEYLGDGGIVLAHSIYDNSYEAMKMFIPYLKEQGYVLVTLSELFYYKGAVLEEGVVYYDGFGATSRDR